MKKKTEINIKSKSEIKVLRDAGRILAEIVKELKRFLKAGITTHDINIEAENLIRKYRVIPAFKGYRGFPASVCVSINEEVVHGIPSYRVLKDGDIVSLDVGIIYNKYYSDMAISVPIGAITSDLENLLKATYESLLKGIAKAKINNHLSDISHAIQKHVEFNNFQVVKEFVGHGIGKNLHENPEIPNFGLPKKGPLLKEGMVFAIEPMVNLGGWKTKILKDNWTVVTLDSKPSAHFEHTVAITDSGPEILTK